MGRFSRIFGVVFRYLVAMLSLAIVFYILFALFVSTEEESRLERENKLYRQLYGQMLERERLIGDVVDGLLEKDDAIYRELFETPAPSLDAITAADLIADDDSLSESFYLSAAASASERLMLMASTVDDNFAQVFRMLEERRGALPPLSLPLKDMSYVQTGASVGMKHNPLLKLELQHYGIDFIAPQGAPVYAAGSGVVTKVIRSRKGLGNTVIISHGNGYYTRYCLLGDLTAVQGRNIKVGQKIGTVGVSASVAASHLHFEVLRDTLSTGGPLPGAVLSGPYQVCDPVHFLFASLSPEEYARMMYMAVSTAQSLD
ncbi:MAG: M23 family metallopeptidase [Bacteroidales bacterium]|nr:M23 family metallopeptidase [Bacteroidales bacterium]